MDGKIKFFFGIVRSLHPSDSRRLAVFLMVAMLAGVGCESPRAGNVTETGNATDPTGTVTLEIDFNGRREYKKLQVICDDKSTVLSILNRAQEVGKVKFHSSGKGETAFVSSIDGVKNEKGSGDNWTFRVNGELCNRSSGIFPAKSGDQILWRFGSYP